MVRLFFVLGFSFFVIVLPLFAQGLNSRSPMQSMDNGSQPENAQQQMQSQRRGPKPDSFPGHQRRPAQTDEMRKKHKEMMKNKRGSMKGTTSDGFTGDEAKEKVWAELEHRNDYLLEAITPAQLNVEVPIKPEDGSNAETFRELLGKDWKDNLMEPSLQYVQMREGGKHKVIAIETLIKAEDDLAEIERLLTVDADKEINFDKLKMKLGLIYADRADDRAAIRMIKAIDFVPNKLEIISALAFSNQFRGNEKDAKQYFSMIPDLPEGKRPFVEYIKYTAIGGNEKVLSISENPDFAYLSPDVKMKLGVYFGKRGNQAKAEEYASMFMGTPKIQERIESTLIEGLSKTPGKAEQYIETISDVHRKRMLYFGLISNYLDQQQFDKAEQTREQLKGSPPYYYYLKLKGAALVKAGKVREAVQSTQELERLEESGLELPFTADSVWMQLINYVNYIKVVDENFDYDAAVREFPAEYQEKLLYQQKPYE